MKALRITAKVDGFRRAGIAHPAAPTIHPLESLTPAQIEALDGEPMLVVEEIDVDEPDGAAGEPAKAEGRGKAKKAAA